MVVLLRNAVSKQKSSPELSQSLLILLQGNSSESNAPVIVFYFRQLVLMSMSTLFCKVFVLMLWFPSVMMILTGNLTLQSLWDALILVSWKILIYNYVSEGMLCNSVMFTPCVHHTKFGNDHHDLYSIKHVPLKCQECWDWSDTDNKTISYSSRFAK